MKIGTILFATLAIVWAAACTPPENSSEKSPEIVEISSPKLVVGIVVDQMRYDYIYRYWDKYSDRGFKRLIAEGFSCDNHDFNYVPTYTGPGHASIYTGTTPAIHGIISNDWFSKPENKMVYCVQDDSVQAIGTDSPKERMSPHRILTSGMGDQIKLAYNFRGKSIGISIKDRAAILPAGRMADAAYWFHGKDEGVFVSSSYYMEQLPAWAADFNSKKLPEQYMNTVWQTMLPIGEYKESHPDNSPFEGLLPGKESPVFPYNPEEVKGKGGYDVLKYMPFGNDLLASFAKATIEGEQLGQSPVTDFLAISFSSTDYAGHMWGTRSVEVEDMYLRLDTTIASLLEFLDSKVGEGKYLLFLTADHGAAVNPLEMADAGVNVGYYDTELMENEVRKKLTEKFGGDDILKSFSNMQFVLDKERMKQLHLEEKSVVNTISMVCMKFPYVHTVLSGRDLMHKQYSERPNHLIQKGWNPQRSGDVMVVVKPGWLDGHYGHTGTSHGSPWAYDTHVPLLLFGWGIAHGATVEPSFVDDITPTILTLLHAQSPMGCTGTPIEDVFED